MNLHELSVTHPRSPPCPPPSRPAPSTGRPRLHRRTPPTAPSVNAAGSHSGCWCPPSSSSCSTPPSSTWPCPPSRPTSSSAPTAVTWVVNAYVLAFGGLLLLSGRAADLFGRRRMFVAGSAVFTVGTLLAAFATSQGLLVGGRIVQGVGAAALSPAAMSLLLLTYPGPQRARAMSIWGAASALGGATGVMAGGLLVGTLRLVVGVPRDRARLGRRRRHRPARCCPKVPAALAAGSTGTARPPSPAPSSPWSTAPSASPNADSTSPTVLASLAASGRPRSRSSSRSSAAPPTHSCRSTLFRSRTLSTGVGLAVLGGAARASTFVLVALYLQQALAMAPQQAGLAMVPTSLTGFAFSLCTAAADLARPRPAAQPRPRAGGPRRRPPVAGLRTASERVRSSQSSPASCSSPSASPSASRPPPWSSPRPRPRSHAGLASGLAGSATQVGAALGTATFTAIGISVGAPATTELGATGFSAAFTAAAVVALATAALGSTISRTRP